MHGNIRIIAVGLAAIAVAIAVIFVASPPSGPVAQPSPAVGPSVAVATATSKAAPSPSPRPTLGVPSTSASTPPGPTPAPLLGDAMAPVEIFESHVFEYRLRHPSIWTPHVSDDPGSSDHLDGVGYTWFAIASPIEAGTTLEAYLSAHPISRLEHGDCVIRRSASTVIRPPVGSTEWAGIKIDGHAAAARSMCGYVDGVVVVYDRAFHFTLRRSAVRGDDALFRRIAATIELPRRFKSTVHRYGMTLPPGWDPMPARKAAWADRFEGPRRQELRVLVQDNAGDDPIVWANEHFDRRVVISKNETSCQWTSGIIWLPAIDTQFEPSTIDGHAAAVRSSCGFVEAAVIVGKQVYSLSLDSGHHTAGGDATLFDRLIRGLRFGGADRVLN